MRGSTSELLKLSMSLRDFDDSDSFGTIGKTVLDDYRKYAKDVEYTSLSREEVGINGRLNEFRRRNKHRARYKKLIGADIRSRKVRFLGFIPSYGYLRSNDKRSWEYLYDLRNTLVDEVDDDDVPIVNLLLVNYGKKLHHVAEMDSNPQNLIDSSFYHEKAMEAYADALDKHFTASLFSVDGGDIKFAAKKTSSLGFPWETWDGIPITNEMLTMQTSSAYTSDYGHKGVRFLKDWSIFKNEWRANYEKGSLGIFQKQLKFIDVHKGVVNEGNIIPLMESCMISVHKTAERENAAKSPKIGREKVSLDTRLPIEDRTFCAYDIQDGNVVGRITGLIDGERYYDLQHQIMRQPGACNRNRIISPSDNNMHCVGTVLATACLHTMEHDNPHGMPAPQEVVIKGVETFLQVMHQKGLLVQICNGDGVNAEVTMTTSWETIVELWPERFREYLTLTAHSVSTYKSFLRYHGNSFCSAVWYTTIGNVVKGNFEMARLLYSLLRENNLINIPEEVFVTLYVDCIGYNVKKIGVAEKKRLLKGFYNEEADCLWFEDTKVAIYPLLGTDDINAIIATPFELRVSDAFKSMLKKTLMTFEVSDSVVTFGSRISVTGMTKNLGSGLSKAHFDENMGFALKDGFSTYAKLNESPLRDTFNSVMKKHFGCTVDDYLPFADGFMGFLIERGIHVDEVFNEHSPTEKLLIDSFVKDRYYSELKGDAFGTGVLVDAKTITEHAANTPAHVVDRFLYDLRTAFYSPEEIASLEVTK